MLKASRSSFAFLQRLEKIDATQPSHAAAAGLRHSRAPASQPGLAIPPERQRLTLFQAMSDLLPVLLTLAFFLVFLYLGVELSKHTEAKATARGLAHR